VGNIWRSSPTVSAVEGDLGAEMITYDPPYFVYDQLFKDIYGASMFLSGGMGLVE